MPSYKYSPVSQSAAGYAVGDKERSHGMPRLNFYVLGVFSCLIAEAVTLNCAWFMGNTGYILVSFLVGLAFFVYLCSHAKSQRGLDTRRATLLGAVVGVAGAAVAYTLFMRAYWSYSSGKHYKDVATTTTAKEVPNGQLFEFAKDSYVKKELTGVFEHHSGTTYCAAPVLERTDTPQNSAVFWAVAQDCCSGSPPNVVSTCSDFSAGFMAGERDLHPNPGHWMTAAEKAELWYNFDSEPERLFVHMMSAQVHEDEQTHRMRWGFSILGVAPLVWPIAYVTFMAGAICMNAVCCAGPKNWDDEDEQGVDNPHIF